MMKQKLLFSIMLLTFFNSSNGSQEQLKNEELETKAEQTEKKPQSEQSKKIEQTISEVIEKWNKIYQNGPQ